MILTLVVLALSSSSFLAVNSQGIVCNVTSPCPESTPCCSEYGFCGTGNFCLGGCNPLYSNSLDSCLPNPVCEDATHTFTDNSRILTNASYFDGNASEYDWVVDKGSIINTNSSGGELGLILTETNGGTRLSSTRYVHYGTISAKLKTGRWPGVVTAFITMSNIKDEIDWEFPGANTTTGQTNYYWQGVIPNATHGETETGVSDTFSNYHEYTIDWQPDALTFSIDSNVVRTIKQSDAVNPTTGVNEYPNTPSRIQLSLWPAGINTSAPGTIQWSGGMINWQDSDYVSAGHFYALVQSVTVKCADPQSPGANITSYVYGSNQTTDTPTVAFSNQTTINGAGHLFELPWFMLGGLGSQVMSWMIPALLGLVVVHL
ncbi:glycoside hydrolase family 16 protein [Lentinula raphanica]|nr:glycoside hydrolase family 16 protein [Lentinula raphanica]